ncbi:MAG: 50S ribosomal protein L6 [Candidatus Nealsonbacteria bacterium CG23_combo_of_CG06-09_8_20_14_all_36_12]|uniref:Large ribosomal subunit protein uL6 n=2 Tax=Candidatus Nealsoniibacteriota TaxID=1817911 RepID=A0A2H0TL41_9BACT|nr:MAG: 50S ribosomal protein L6 [Candidatus Nealsonbacteria bacterium CG23_combo_of_CG06-09_8_20_14_all_36_12]PIR72875.1 MAG: 50S ribosomal protein L6 [Candidatus Nealsonbacteria bacterium CG10_big_fil_rev_8_21_14_0_10_36_23]
MSRIGKKPILIPEDVEVKIEPAQVSSKFGAGEGQKVVVKGPKGELSQEVRPEIKVETKGGQIFISPKIETKRTSAFWGLTRALIANMIRGVTEGYEKKLEIEGLGYRAQLEGENLVLSVGFTHPVKIDCPSGIKFSIEKNVITVSGADKELVGQIASKIRKVRPPEPYKGKGIKYQGEVIRRKAGKKVVTTTT